MTLPYENLENYRKKVENELNQLDLIGCLITNEDIRKNVLLGLSIQYVQEKYNEKKMDITVFDYKHITRDSFVEYLRKNVCTESEKSIGAYLHTVVLECWNEIVRNNIQLTPEQGDVLEYLRDRTMEWIFSLASKPQGQFQLLNTVSQKIFLSLENYCAKSISERQNMVYEQCDLIQDFLRYFWKIIIDVNQNLLGVPIEQIDKEKFSPQSYIDEAELQYICIHFAAETAKSVVILPDIGNGRKEEKLRNIFGRMKKIQPEKWYMCGTYQGSYRYDLDVSEIKNVNIVSSIAENRFRIECMECIKIDEDCWHTMEKCEDHVFQDKCVKCKEGDK